MDGDDEFGDLYGGLDESREAEAPTTSAPYVPEQVSNPRSSQFEEDYEFDVGGGFSNPGGEQQLQLPQYTTANSFQLEEEDDFDLYDGLSTSAKKQTIALKPVERTSEELQKNVLPQPQQPQLQERPPPRAPGHSDSDSDDEDDDLRIVLNNDNRVHADVELPGTGVEASEEVEDAPPSSGNTLPWTDEQPAPTEAPLTLPPQAPIGIPGIPGIPPGIPPGILPGMPPGLMIHDHAGRPPGLQNHLPPRPSGPPRPQFRYVRAPMAGGHMMNANPGVLGRGTFPPGSWAPPGKGPVARPWTGPPGFPHTEHHLPPTKSVFDLDLDALEDKPWRHPHADITDYFNFGFSEDTWKAYCQQLNQVRIKATMQNKISVYESGRSDQPVGKAIQVEGGMGERRASIDLRRNRNRDSNEVIEIVLCEPEVETPYFGNDYDGSVTEELADMFRMRNGPYMDAEGPFGSLGARPRGPYRFPGPFGRGGIRPPFYEPGMPPPPMLIRPEVFPGVTGEVGDPSRRGAAGKNSSRGRGGDDEQSSGSVVVKDEHRHPEDRRKSGREQEEDERSDDKKSLSDKRHSDDDESHRSRHRSRKEGADGEHEDLKRSSGSHERDRGDRSEKGEKERDREPRKDEDSSKRSHHDRDEGRWKEDDRKRRDEDRRREDDRRRDEWQRREREEPYKKERDDSQKRKSSYESKRYDKAAADEEEYQRRKRKYRDSRHDDEHYEHRKSSSSRREREHSEDEERAYKDKHGWSSKSKDEGRRNGSTSEYVDDRKKRKPGDYHAEKVVDDEERRSRRPSSRTETYDTSSDDGEDGKQRKGRSKMERLNRERQFNEDEAPSRHRSDTEPRQKANGADKEFQESAARRRERFSKLENPERKPLEKEKQSLVDAAEFKHERPTRKRRWGS